jgi:hypothetical protein
MTLEQIKASPWYLWLELRYGDEIASRIIRETVAQARAEWVAELEPWAYVALAENGNTRMWRHAKDREAMEEWAAEHAPGCQLIALALIPKA